MYYVNIKEHFMRQNKEQCWAFSSWFLRCGWKILMEAQNSSDYCSSEMSKNTSINYLWIFKLSKIEAFPETIFSMQSEASSCLLGASVWARQWDNKWVNESVRPHGHDVSLHMITDLRMTTLIGLYIITPQQDAAQATRCSFTGGCYAALHYFRAWAQRFR